MAHPSIVESKPVAAAATPPLTLPAAPGFRRFLLFAGLLALCYALPFYDLLRLALKRDLFSHLPLIPFICGYLVWLRRSKLAAAPDGARWPGVVLGVVGVGALAMLWLGGWSGWLAAPGNRLPILILSFWLLLWSGGFFLLGGKVMRELAFPALFLLFMAPFPPGVVDGIEMFLQYASADVAYLFLQWAGIPVLRTGLLFEMPGLSITVAPECSGIRSSLVLFITSLLAGYLFLPTAWKRALLALIVIPLGIARNAFRILVLSWLCVYVDPSYINSAIHHRGGPIFFVLSLVPFSLVLLWLLKSEKHSQPPRNPADVP